jgi:glycosyltransferase involved in cell wall biosynthesis
MSKPLNVLFDASCIVHAINSRHVNRAGIFWVAYNVLKQFHNSLNYNVTLLVPFEYYFKKNCELKRFLSSFSKVIFNDKNLLLNNIKFYTSQLLKSFDILLILKIIKNIFLLFFSNKNIKKKINKINLFFSPVFAIPDILMNKKEIKTFIILHDGIPLLKNIPNNSLLSFNSWYSLLIKNINYNTYYFCVSECTKKDFFKYFSDRLDEKKMFVTYNAASQSFLPDYDKHSLQKAFSKYGIKYSNDIKYIFSFCSIDPRKNLAFTIKCFLLFINKHNIKDLYFFLGGAHFIDYIDQFKEEISVFNEYSDKIIRLGYVDDEDVNVLYSNSLFFTYLSLYEGFGMPPLEAMQSGTPVICSNNSSLPEVTGDAAILVDCNNEEQCIKAFEDLYFNEDLRNEYIKKGIERGKLFSWDKTFDLMHKNITEILS